ncbi:methylmalonyl-CoA mutase subunit beta [uncultured Psychroserpens sp.]|uniref:methylmalonyl-CoA mutase subunit beta n=1 Tax=uncultured Psychroserpens sp. TaxID=255436 RepID=UPI002609D539|nr:methylmalonyl-CoA mutase subunit beta [uncultured Psychroserpens sp.]
MSKTLFSDFPEISSKQWKQKIQADLKGADYNDTLIWHTNEGIDVKPFYHADDFEQLESELHSTASTFNIGQTIFVANTEKSNANAIDAISRGAETIIFVIPSEDISIENLLKNIDTASTPIIIKPEFLSPKFVKQVASYDHVNLEVDIIGHLARTGNWYHNLTDDHSLFEATVKHTNTLSVDVGLYQNAGANMIQQLAYALAHINEYLNHFDDQPNTIQKQSLKVIFNVAVGTNYFFEIAKLRALRLLFKTIANAYPINTDCIINVSPTKRNKTIYDYNTNMLRTTTECMSAVLGGANTIINLPYDAIYHKSNEFADRISRNQLLILKHESYFDKVGNPSDGAYYIESLTSQMASKSLTLFKDIEANGGFLSQLKEGTIQKKIKESAIKEQSQFDTGDFVLLGTNKHPNPQDKMKEDLELYPFVKTNPIKTLIEPIIEKRLAETIEQERLKTE